MKQSHAVTRGSALRAVLHLAAVLAMVAALGVVTARTADAAKSRSSKSKSTSTTHRASAAKVDINSATEKDLEDLPGVGTVMAQRIIAGRPYKSVPDLKRAGIPPSTIKGITGRVKAGRTAAATSEGGSRATERAVERPSEASSASRHEAPAPAKAAPQRTFFGIPIGGPAKASTKEAPAAGEGSRAVASERPPVEEAPAKGMVWVNLDSNVYHVEGDRWYGATKHGKYMWEDQAIREGYRASKTGPKPH